MKIGLIVPGGVDRSGEYRVVPALLALIRRLSDRHDLHVFALAQERTAGEWALGDARIHNVGMPNSQLRGFRALVKEHRSAPFDILQAIWSGGCGLISVAAGRILDVPSFVHVAGGELVALPDIAYGGSRTWYGRARERLVLRNATCVTAASAPVLHELERIRVHARRVALGVDLKTWPPREPVLRKVPGTLRLIHVASLNPIKDQATLLQALARLATTDLDFRMDIVGEDTLSGRLQRQAAQLGIADRITFHGFLTQRQWRPLLDAAHLNVVSSRHETGPLVLLESAVAGVPTVGTQVGHVAEYAPEAAVAVQIGKATQLAGAIADLAHDEDRRLALARRAQQRALAEDADATAAQFEEMYRAAVGRPPAIIN